MSTSDTKVKHRGPDHLPVELKSHVLSFLHVEYHVRALLALSRCSKSMNQAYAPMLEDLIYEKEEIAIDERIGNKLTYGIDWQHPDSPIHQRKYRISTRSRNSQYWISMEHAASPPLWAFPYNPVPMTPHGRQMTRQRDPQSSEMSPHSSSVTYFSSNRSTKVRTMSKWHFARASDPRRPKVPESCWMEMYVRLMEEWNLDVITWHLHAGLRVVDPRIKARHVRIYCHYLKYNASIVNQVYTLVQPIFRLRIKTRESDFITDKIELVDTTWGEDDSNTSPITIEDLIQKRISTTKHKQVKEEFMTRWRKINLIDRFSTPDPCPCCGGWE
ncbi:hypothetical protein CI109_106237 [Kwoniella shandongensis]|uniref:F-box domain-containing protein n=1 Tax=Kwoniella shandongensis TaxID=1734106 RepID=A0AAJ8LR28_9TREE